LGATALNHATTAQMVGSPTKHMFRQRGGEYKETTGKCELQYVPMYRRKTV